MAIKRLLIVAVLLAASNCHAVANCFASTSVTNAGVASAPMNSTGATILIAFIGSYAQYVNGMYDNVGNLNWETGSPFDIGAAGSGPFGMIVYKVNPSTSVSHTFTIPAPPASAFHAAIILACSGTTLDHPFSQQVGTYVNGTGGGAFQPGSVTPVEAGDLIVTMGTSDTSFSTATVDSGFATPLVVNTPVFEKVIGSWLSAPNTTPINLTWTTDSDRWVGITAVFKADTATPPTKTGPIITTVAGSGIEGCSGVPGPATSTSVKLDYPGQIVTASNGLVIFTVVNCNQILGYNPTPNTLTYGATSINAGWVVALAGNGTLGFVDNVPRLSGEFAHPVGLTIDLADCVYVADQQNNMARKFCPAGNVITVAGGAAGVDGPGCSTPGQSAATSGFSGDGGVPTSANLSCPQGIAIDTAINVLYISDTNNYRSRAANLDSVTHVVNGVSIAANTIKTVFGNGTNACSMTGTGTTSEIGGTLGIRVNATHDIFVASYNCNQIFTNNNAGVSAVLVGNGTAGYVDAAAASAELNTPFDIDFTTNGDMLIADTQNGAIRKWDHATGLVSTLAGNHTLYPYFNTFWVSGGYCCDGSSANLAGLFYPIGVKVSSFGRVYVGDLGNSRLRRISTLNLGAFIGDTAKIVPGVKVQ